MAFTQGGIWPKTGLDTGCRHGRTPARRLLDGTGEKQSIVRRAAVGTFKGIQIHSTSDSS